MSEIKWVEAPPTSQRAARGYWPQVLDELKARPGKWAMLREYKNSATAGGAAAYLRRTVTEGRWEFVSRGAHVFGRYLGKGPGEEKK